MEEDKFTAKARITDARTYYIDKDGKEIAPPAQKMEEDAFLAAPVIMDARTYHVDKDGKEVEPDLITEIKKEDSTDSKSQ